MAFHAFPFLLGFLPVALAGYALAGKRGGDAGAKACLAGASILFYGLANPRDLPLLLLMTAANGLLLRRMAGRRHSSRLAWTGVAGNLALLAWFKFAVPLIWPERPAPVGLSFWTFSQITCLLAAADGVRVAWRDHALLSLFFPVLTAGPVLSAQESLPAFTRRTGWRLTQEAVSIGGGFFLIGLMKKNLLSDPLAPVVAAGFGDAGASGMLSAWQAAAAWSLQLYFDFSGYSDMAIGLGWMFGIQLPDNFDQPYRAQSVIEYWQRWHMSLTRFLMNHVHAPLTLMAMRRRRARRLPVGQAAQKTAAGFATMIAAPVMLTMLAAGLWHGAALTYLMFGATHGLFLVVNHAWRLWRGPALPPVVSIALTYACVLVGGVVFRAGSLDQAGGMLAGMAGWHGIGTLSTDPRDVFPLLWIIALYGVVWFAPTTRAFMQGPGWLRWEPSARWGLAMGCAGAAGLLASGGTQEFVYFSF